MKKLTSIIFCWFVVAMPVIAGELTPIVPVGPHPEGVQVNDLDFSWTALDSVNGSTFVCTGRELLLARYVAGTTANLTIASVTDEYSRNGNITDYELIPGEYAAFWFGNSYGWANSSGNATITSTTSSIGLAVLRINRPFRKVTSATTAGAYTPQTVVGPYPTTVAANSLNFTMAAGVVAAATFPMTQADVLILYNSGAGANTVTLTSQADRWGRTGHITSYSIGAGEYAAFFYGDLNGWADSNGCASITCGSAEVYVSVLKLPTS